VVAVRTTGFLWEKQTLDQQLNDLALARWRRYLARLSQPGDVGGNPGLMPGIVASATLQAVQALYDVVKAGQTLLVIGQVRSEP
jgi:hypothetical protein